MKDGFSGSDKFFKYAQSMHDFSCSSLAAIFFTSPVREKINANENR